MLVLKSALGLVLPLLLGGCRSRPGVVDCESLGVEFARQRVGRSDQRPLRVIQWGWGAGPDRPYAGGNLWFCDTMAVVANFSSPLANLARAGNGGPSFLTFA